MTVELRSAYAARAHDLDRIGSATEGSIVAGYEPFLTQVDLRADPSETARVPYALPRIPNTAWEKGDRAALWLGPDEWLILGPPGAGARIVEELAGALEGVPHSIVDVSAARAALEIGGPGAHELLSKGCSLDLHPREWRRGMCAQTLLARIPVILHERADATGVLVRASFADYLLDWLLFSAL